MELHCKNSSSPLRRDVLEGESSRIWIIFGGAFLDPLEWALNMDPPTGQTQLYSCAATVGYRWQQLQALNPAGPTAEVPKINEKSKLPQKRTHAGDFCKILACAV